MKNLKLSRINGLKSVFKHNFEAGKWKCGSQQGGHKNPGWQCHLLMNGWKKTGSQVLISQWALLFLTSAGGSRNLFSFLTELPRCHFLRYVLRICYLGAAETDFRFHTSGSVFFTLLSDIRLKVHLWRFVFSVPPCVQRRAGIGLYGDVTHRDDVGTMWRFCLPPAHLLLLRPVDIHLRNWDFCRHHRVLVPDLHLKFCWIKPTVCLRLWTLVSSSSGSNNSRLFSFQEVLRQTVVTLAQKQLMNPLPDVLDHIRDGEVGYLLVVVRHHVAHGDNQWGESGSWLRFLLPTVFHQIKAEDGEGVAFASHSWNLWICVRACPTCSAARVRGDSSCILSSGPSKTPASAGRLGTGCRLEQTTVQKLASHSLKIQEKKGL